MAKKACIVPWYEILCRRWLVCLVAGDGVSIGGLGPIILMSLRTAEMNMSEAIKRKSERNHDWSKVRVLNRWTSTHQREFA